MEYLSTQEETSEAKALGEKLNISNILSLLLVRRGIKGLESAAKRLFPILSYQN